MQEHYLSLTTKTDHLLHRIAAAGGLEQLHWLSLILSGSRSVGKLLCNEYFEYGMFFWDRAKAQKLYGSSQKRQEFVLLTEAWKVLLDSLWQWDW